MKKTVIFLAACCFLASARAGQISQGAVPGSINYQGRLERDNAPISGPVHITFRIYNAAASGTLRWTEPEQVVNATQGIFSAIMTPPWSVFSRSEGLYLEVQVESDILLPREPLNSVAYAIVAKKLEDGSDLGVSTLTAAYQVLLATVPGSNVGIGTTSPGEKLTVNGGIKLLTLGSGITFPNGTVMTSAGVGSAVGGVSSDDFVVIRAANLGTGDIVFNTPAIEIARMTNGGSMGIGTDSPKGTLDVNGSIYVGSEGLHGRDAPGDVNIIANLNVSSGVITGANSEHISLGETDDVIALVSGGAERMRVHSNGFVGVGLADPTEPLHVAGNIASNAGVRGGGVSMGAYTGWTSAANEIRSDNSSHLLLQQNNPHYVGIGLTTPLEKLHVHGTVRADYGVAAATGAFSGAVSVNGNLTANGNNKQVFLTSTTIYGDSWVYGDLTVTGGIGSMAGMPAYIASTQTFSGTNTFLGPVRVSSDVVAASRVGSGVVDFDFPGSKYLQVGDNIPEFANDNALAYLVGGSNANAKLDFYRGATESARLETQDGRNLALVIDGKTRTLTDGTYHRIQNSVLWVSTGYATTPAVFVSSYMGNVGMGTSVLDPNWRLTVEGNIRISTTSSTGKNYGLIFADGTTLYSAGSIGSAVSISNNGDAVVQADADLTGGGSVILRAGSVDGLLLNSGGNIGIGTANPVSKLNIRGGDLVLGTPVNPYDGDGNEDLIVGGNMVFDGDMIQRSGSTVDLAGLDVAGNINGGSISTGGTVRISGTGVVGSGGANATWDGAAIAVNRGGTGAVALTGVLKGNGTSAITAMTGSANAAARWSDANTIAASAIVSDNGTRLTVAAPEDLTGSITTASSGTFKASGANQYSVETSSGIKVDNGTLSAPAFRMTSGAVANYVLTSNDGSGNAIWQSVDLLSSKDPTVGNEVTDATNATLTRSGAGNAGNPYTLAINLGNANTWTAMQTFSGGIAGALTGNAATVTNGVYTTGSYSDPAWITALAGSKITGGISGNAATVTNGVYTTGAYSDPSWLTSLSASKISGTLPVANGGTGNTTGNAATATALAANGSNCSTGNYPLGVDASGNSENCTSLGNASVNHVVCWKSAGSLGYCSAVVASDGTCGTCN